MGDFENFYKKKQISEFWVQKYKNEASKNWNGFYKRNKTNFFKNRHWILSEFKELTQSRNKKLLEIGCGVGNTIFPLLEDLDSIFIYACDFSFTAIDFVKNNVLYDTERCYAFECDLTIENNIEIKDLDFITSIFVLSAIPPEKQDTTMNKGGILFFRDYGCNDAAELRFKPTNKLGDHFFVRQDGTLAYYFDISELEQLFLNNGFEVLSCEYVQRTTINVKRDVSFDRTFIQAKFIKK